MELPVDEGVSQRDAVDVPCRGVQNSPVRLVYTVEEVADLVGLARSTMYERVHAGDVASVRFGRRLFITAPTIEALIGVAPPSPAELAARREDARGERGASG